MELIDEISTANGKKLQLFKGNLTMIPENHRVDVLVISAFPGDYIPTPGSLIGALDETGLSVADLAANKAEDLRAQFDSWLSNEINFKNIKRILCFEPVKRNNPYKLIAGIFKSIMLFAKTYAIETIAIPLVLTGDQGFSDANVVNELVSTSLLWLGDESPLNTIKIVEINNAKIGLIKKAFEDHKPTYSQQTKTDKYDFFVSYSREDAAVVDTIHKKLKDKFTLFFDTESIEIGANWLNKLNTSLPKSERFIVCMSPEYIKSKMCQYEFLYCNMKLINQGDDYVLPVYLYSTSLPFQMQILNYFDAREGEPLKIEAFCKRLIKKYSS